MPFRTSATRWTLDRQLRAGRSASRAARCGAASSPYRASPGRTAVTRGRGVRLAMPPVALAWTHRGGSMASRNESNRSSCSSVVARSLSSARARWVNTPSSRTPWSDAIARYRSAASASGAPSRVSPVSTLKCSAAVVPAARAASAMARAPSTSHTVIDRSSCTAASRSACSVAPRSTSTGSCARVRRSTIASSTVATARPAAPASIAASAMASAPWP